jgi:hypothetical protein
MPRTNVVGTTAPSGSGAQRCAQAGEREHRTDSTARDISPTNDGRNSLTATPPQLIGLIKAHIAKGDKAKDKAEQHYIAAGQHLKTLKATHGGSWAEWEKLLETELGIGKSRASELMAIADGTKTVEQIRADTNIRKVKHRQLSPFRNGEDEPETNETKIKALLRGAEHARRCARFDGVPNQETIEAVCRTVDAWNELHSSMVATKDRLCRFVKDDGGREASGIAQDPRRKNETGDCVTRAIAIATGKPYREVHDALTVGTVRHLYAGGDSRHPEWSKHARRRGGVCVFDPDHGCADGVWVPYLESLGWRRVSTEGQKVRLRADELPLGRLVVQIRRHLVAVIDGVIHDTFNSGDEGRVRVKGYWSAPSVSSDWRPTGNGGGGRST